MCLFDPAEVDVRRRPFRLRASGRVRYGAESTMFYVPLRQRLITTNMPSFTSLASLPGLGMATFISVSVHGRVNSNTYLRRDGPPPGPAIFMTGGVN